jgi:hypothetical protein
VERVAGRGGNLWTKGDRVFPQEGSGRRGVAQRGDCSREEGPVYSCQSHRESIAHVSLPLESTE